MIENLPIEMFYVFMTIFGAMFIAGIVWRDSSAGGVFMFVSGISLVVFFIPVDSLAYTPVWTGGDTANTDYYDVRSSTGQVLVNSVTAHSRGERLVNTGSMLVGDEINCITVWLGRSGTLPGSPNVEVGVMDTSTNFVKSFGVMTTAEVLSSANTPYEFCLSDDDSYVITGTETIGVKWNGGDASNTLTMRVDANNPFDAGNSEHAHATASSWIGNSGQDLMMQASFAAGNDGFASPDPIVVDPLVKVLVVLFGSLMCLFAWWLGDFDFGFDSV